MHKEKMDTMAKEPFLSFLSPLAHRVHPVTHVHKVNIRALSVHYDLLHVFELMWSLESGSRTLLTVVSSSRDS